MYSKLLYTMPHVKTDSHRDKGQPEAEAEVPDVGASTVDTDVIQADGEITTKIIAKAKEITKTITKAINNVITKADAKAPTKVFAKAPAKVFAKAPAKAAIKARAKALAKAPTKALAKAPIKAHAKAHAKAPIKARPAKVRPAKAKPCQCGKEKPCCVCSQCIVASPTPCEAPVLDEFSNVVITPLPVAPPGTTSALAIYYVRLPKKACTEVRLIWPLASLDPPIGQTVEIQLRIIAPDNIPVVNPFNRIRLQNTESPTCGCSEVVYRMIATTTATTVGPIVAGAVAPTAFLGRTVTRVVIDGSGRLLNQVSDVTLLESPLPPPPPPESAVVQPQQVGPPLTVTIPIKNVTIPFVRSRDHNGNDFWVIYNLGNVATNGE